MGKLQNTSQVGFIHAGQHMEVGKLSPTFQHRPDKASPTKFDALVTGMADLGDLRRLQIWPPGGATCFVSMIIYIYWLNQLVLYWYIHQLGHIDKVSTIF